MEIGVIGATGLVGVALVEEIIDHITMGYHLHLFGRKSTELRVRDTCFRIHPMEQLSHHTLDIVLLATPSEVSLKWIPWLRSKSNAFIIDGSSAFRQDASIPLVIPEITPTSEILKASCVASPNCTTTLALMALHPLHKLFGLQSFSLCSYQAASGAGREGYEELVEQCKDWAMGKPMRQPYAFPRTLLFNAIPQIGALDASGLSEEERKILTESRKILCLPDLKVSATCVRIPTLTCHSMAISATFDKKFSLEQAKIALENAPGIQFYDKDYPDVFYAIDNSLCHVGRLRWDATRDKTLSLWVVGNQLLKGSATNMRQILETKIRAMQK